MDSNVCKISDTCATKPIFCDSCNTNVHSDCSLSAGHPPVNGRFLDRPRGAQSLEDSREDLLIRQFGDMLHFELDKFTETITEACKADTERIQLEISKIADLAAALDLKLARFDRSLVANGTSCAGAEETTVARNVQAATGARHRYSCATSGIKDPGRSELEVSAPAGRALCSHHVQEHRSGRTSSVPGVKPLWGRILGFANTSPLRRPRISGSIRKSQKLNAKED